MALKKSTFLSSGHKVSQKYSSEYEDCHNKNPLKRSSPLVLMMRFGSSIPSEVIENVASFSGKDGES